MSIADDIRRALGESSWWAREASQNKEVPSGYEEEGARWQWICSSCSWKDNAIPDIDVTSQEVVICPRCQSSGVQWTSTLRGGLPIWGGLEDVPSVIGVYLLRHDPAATIRLDTALFRIVELCESQLEGATGPTPEQFAAGVLLTLKDGLTRDA